MPGTNKPRRASARLHLVGVATCKVTQSVTTKQASGTSGQTNERNPSKSEPRIGERSPRSHRNQPQRTAAPRTRDSKRRHECARSARPRPRHDKPRRIMLVYRPHRHGAPTTPRKLGHCHIRG